MCPMVTTCCQYFLCVKGALAVCRPRQKHFSVAAAEAQLRQWTHWDLSPEPSAREADVMPLHRVPHGHYLLPVLHLCTRALVVCRLRQKPRLNGSGVWGSSPGPPAHGADVMPLDYAPPRLLPASRSGSAYAHTCCSLPWPVTRCHSRS